MANPIAGPSSRSWARNPAHPATSLPCTCATAISTRITGSTMMSFVPASILSTCRTERGTLESRTSSRSTTGSVEASIAPPMNAMSQPNPSINASGSAPNVMISAVPGPRISAGISQRRPSSSTCRLSASRKSTKESVSAATTSRMGSCGPISSSPNPLSPSMSPSPRNRMGNDRGEPLYRARHQRGDHHDDRYKTEGRQKLR